jgi:hypothetical protein
MYRVGNRRYSRCDVPKAGLVGGAAAETTYLRNKWVADAAISREVRLRLQLTYTAGWFGERENRCAFHAR